MCYCDCVIHPVESGPFFILHRAIPVTSVMGYAHKKGNLLHCVIPVTSVVGYARKKGISRTWIFNSWKSGQILKSEHPRAMQGIVRGCVCETGGSASGHTEETLIPDGRQERRHKTGFSYEIPDCVKNNTERVLSVSFLHSLFLPLSGSLYRPLVQGKAWGGYSIDTPERIPYRKPGANIFISLRSSCSCHRRRPGCSGSPGKGQISDR